MKDRPKHGHGGGRATDLERNQKAPPTHECGLRGSPGVPDKPRIQCQRLSARRPASRCLLRSIQRSTYHLGPPGHVSRQASMAASMFSGGVRRPG